MAIVAGQWRCTRCGYEALLTVFFLEQCARFGVVPAHHCPKAPKIARGQKLQGWDRDFADMVDLEPMRR